MATIVMAGGGTGGHVVPLLAVARELKARGHQCVFIGTRTGFEAKMVPAVGFSLEFIEIGGLKRVGALRTIRTLAQLPLSVLKVIQMLNKHQPSAVFSLGGYAAGPVVLATL
ncbi:MAG TPA: glycosyltransferase, partial [Bryobacteraceae bacterium]|nr:glycosyltransferase [Bryobacteraceae bacterium]